MSDNMLKREFKTRDVQRMRNILTKDYGAKTGVQIGYNKGYVERKEGDVWQENNKTWTIKNGIKMTVTKLDNVKKALQMPLTCPNCNQPMNKGRLDKLMYSIHKQCSDCVIKYETKLKIEGKFEEYQKTINNLKLKYCAIVFDKNFSQYQMDRKAGLKSTQGLWPGLRISNSVNSNFEDTRYSVYLIND